MFGANRKAGHRPQEVTVNVTYPTINKSPEVVRELAWTGHDIALDVYENMAEKDGSLRVFVARNLFGKNPTATLLHRPYFLNDEVESADVTVLRGQQAFFVGDHSVSLGYPALEHRIADVVLYDVVDEPKFLAYREGMVFGSGSVPRGSAKTVFGLHLTTLDPKQNDFGTAYNAPVHTEFTLLATDENMGWKQFVMDGEVPDGVYEQAEVALEAIKSIAYS